MKILIKNCNLISMSENRKKYEQNIDILIEDNKIKRIEKNINEDCEKVINASGKVVMPGLINTHSHISMSIFRETVDGLKTQDWLTQKIWPMEDKLTNEDIYYATMLSCIEMIETGCTCINDMYFMTEDIIKAALESGVRLQTTRTLMGHNKEDLIRLDELNNLLENYKYETITFNAGIHGLYTSNEEYVKKCVDFAEEKNLPIHMHFCENQVIDSVISYYCALAERNTIPFHVQIDLPAQISVDETDFCLVLSNLLENALEASLKTAKFRQRIDIKIYRHASNLILIQIENAFDGKIQQKHGIFLSSKRNENGIGIQSVRHIVEKTGGGCDFTYDNGIFTAKIMLRPCINS